MEVMLLVLWLVVVSIAAPLMLLGAFSAPWLVVQGMAAFGGFTFAALFLAFDEDWMAWASFALAVVGFAGAGAGAAQLIDDEPSGPGGGAVELAAALAGAAVPFFLVTVGIALGTALTDTRIVDPL